MLLSRTRVLNFVFNLILSHRSFVKKIHIPNIDCRKIDFPQVCLPEEFLLITDVFTLQMLLEIKRSKHTDLFSAFLILEHALGGYSCMKANLILNFLETCLTVLVHCVYF